MKVVPLTLLGLWDCLKGNYTFVSTHTIKDTKVTNQERKTETYNLAGRGINYVTRTKHILYILYKELSIQSESVNLRDQDFHLARNRFELQELNNHNPN